MPTESKTLTEQRIRKERALATMRELQLHQLERQSALGPIKWSGHRLRFSTDRLDALLK